MPVFIRKVVPPTPPTPPTPSSPPPEPVPPPQVKLRKPQARVLALLMPADPTSYWTEWPTVNRAELASRAGYTPLSGTLTRVLNGIKAGSSSNGHKGAEPGLLELKYIEEERLDLCGVIEVNYRATAAGVQAYQEYIRERGEPVTSRSKAGSTNKRYQPCPCGSGKQLRHCYCTRNLENSEESCADDLDNTAGPC